MRVGAYLVGLEWHDLAWGWPAFKLTLDADGVTLTLAMVGPRPAAVGTFESASASFDAIASAQLARRMWAMGVRLDIPPSSVWYLWPGTVDRSGAVNLLRLLQRSGVKTIPGIHRLHFFARGDDRSVRRQDD